jgi:malate dehydrogenase (oxaloacetate-decarboxylating)
VEDRLREELDIPVFHDDQHGTAVVVLAGAINALKLTNRQPEDTRVVVAGAGAAGYSCTRTLADYGFSNIVVCDRKGAIHAGRDFPDNAAKAWMAANTNPEGLQGSLKEVLVGADLFVGVSAPGLLVREDIAKMNREPIVFAMSNPVPEVMPEEAEGIAAVIATGRSDYPNQINNVLAFPGIFRGALDARASTINEEMKRATALAIAGVVGDEERTAEYIIPSVFNRAVVQRVASAVSEAARATGVAGRIPKTTGL